MKKIFTRLSAVLLLFSSNKISAQVLVANYSFSSSVSSYSAITSATVLGTNANDDDIFDGIPIGFTFNYGGYNFSQLSVCANGYIKFAGPLSYNGYNPISDNSADDTLISAMGADIQSNAGGVLQYLTSGIAPNRVFIIQWGDYTSFGNMDTLNFQIRLHETSNVIEVFYGHTYVDVNNTYEVGLRGILANNDYNNRSVINNVNTWSTSVAGTSSTDNCELDPSAPLFPDDGLNYVWSPPVPCTGTPSPGNATSTSTLACVSQTFMLNLINSTVASGLTYQWESSPNATAWTPVASATNITQNETYATPIYYHCIVSCGSNSAVSTSIQILPQTANTYTTVPFLENFDNSWQNRCDLRNVPVSANWNSNPTTGDNSWRREDDGVSANWQSNFGINTPLAGIGCANFHSWDATNMSMGSMDLYIDLGSSSNYNLSFYHINSTGDDSLEVFLSIDGGNTFTKKAAYYSGDYSSIDLNWNKKVINLGAPASPTCVIRFTATSDYGADDIGMDSLQINCAGPSLTVTAAQPTVCNGSSVSLVAVGATSYTWSTSANTSSIIVTPSVNSTYTVHGENIPGCSGVNTVTVGVVAGPSISAAAQPNATFCPGQTGTLVAQGANNGFTWTPGGSQFAIILVAPTSNITYTITGANTQGCTTDITLSLYMTTCTSIYDPNNANETIRIFPNPSNGQFVVELANGLEKQIDVMDLTGRIVLSQKTIEDKSDLNITNLSNGVYYIRLRSNNESKVFKIVKE